MLRFAHFAPLLAATAMTLVLATPAQAGKADRAREAIAAADAKIHTAESMGAGSEMPHQTAEAREALAMAREDLSAGNKSGSIADAIRAASLADAAIGEMQRHHDKAAADERQAGRNDVAAARQQTVYAQQQAVSAQQQATMAQQQTSEANSRANAAQLTAAMSANEAANAQNAANAQIAANAAAMASPARVETTVTTEQTARPASRRMSRHHATHHRALPRAAAGGGVTTTTVVTQPAH